MGKKSTEERDDIYFKRDERLDNTKKRLEQWDGPDEDKEVIRQFERYLASKGTGKYRRHKLMSSLRRLCEHTTAPLKRMEKPDIEELEAFINGNDNWAPKTKRDYKRNIKQFFRWYREEDPRLEVPIDPKEDTIERRKRRRDAENFYKRLEKVDTSEVEKKIDPSNIITEADCRTLIKEGCKNPMEKAVISTLHETGIRVGELLNIRLKDIQDKGKHSMILVDGKTGERTVPILKSKPWLQQWLNNHPDNENPNSFLWVSTHNGHHGKPLKYAGIRKMLIRVFERAGYIKTAKNGCKVIESTLQHNPHHFRHSRATLYGAEFSEQVLNKLMGWEQGSSQARTYCHINNRQTEDMWKKTVGLKEEEKEEKPTVQYCTCGTTNDFEARYCHKCGNPLSMSVAMQDEERKSNAIDEAFKMMEKIMNSPKLLEKWKEFQEKRNMEE